MMSSPAMVRCSHLRWFYLLLLNVENSTPTYCTPILELWGSREQAKLGEEGCQSSSGSSRQAGGPPIEAQATMNCLCLYHVAWQKIKSACAHRILCL